MTATQTLGSGLQNIARLILHRRYHTDGRLNMVKVMFDISKLYEITLTELALEEHPHVDVGGPGTHKPLSTPHRGSGSPVAGAGGRWSPGPPCSSNSEPGGNSP